MYNTLTVPCEKSKVVPFASSIMKNIVVFPTRSKFLEKLSCLLLLYQHQELVVYLNLLQSIYNVP